MHTACILLLDKQYKHRSLRDSAPLLADPISKMPRKPRIILITLVFRAPGVWKSTDIRSKPKPPARPPAPRAFHVSRVRSARPHSIIPGTRESTFTQITSGTCARAREFRQLAGFEEAGRRVLVASSSYLLRLRGGIDIRSIRKRQTLFDTNTIINYSEKMSVGTTGNCTKIVYAFRTFAEYDCK